MKPAIIRLKSYEEDDLPGPEFIQPTLLFTGTTAYSTDFGVLAKIEIRQLDNGRLQVFFDNFSSIKSHHEHMENVFNQIYNEILRFWPIAPAEATDISEDAPLQPEPDPKVSPSDTLTSSLLNVIRKSYVLKEDEIAQLSDEFEINRKILLLWWEQKQNSDIGKEIHRVSTTVTNIISLLRKKHGNEIVPFRKSVKKVKQKR